MAPAVGASPPRCCLLSLSLHTSRYSLTVGYCTHSSPGRRGELLAAVEGKGRQGPCHGAREERPESAFNAVGRCLPVHGCREELSRMPVPSPLDLVNPVHTALLCGDQSRWKGAPETASRCFGAEWPRWFPRDKRTSRALLGWNEILAAVLLSEPLDEVICFLVSRMG